ncbi:MAG: hypothetical protein QHH15_00565 [Candidatus Thermoplasmatota archaeon]|nr:hypothetical protein [Candidatus Thermoplasmatota archaeon]
MKKESRSVVKKAGVVTFLVIGFICGISIVAMLDTSLKPPLKTWHVVSEFKPGFPLGDEANPVGGGILEIFFHPHSSTPGTTYAVNDSSVLESASYAWANADNFNLEIPHTVTFDVVVRVRGNRTQCWRNNMWWDSDLKVEWTCADFGVSTDTLMTGVVTANNTGYSYLYMNWYDNNNGAGFSLSKDEIVNIQSIKFSAYY